MLDEKTDEEVIEAIKQFIENPNAGNAIETVRVFASYDLYVCSVSDYWYGFCYECMWESACQGCEPEENITDEEVSAMVLDAIRIVAVYEAKNA